MYRAVEAVMKTKRVRIAIAINADGTDWSAQGWGSSRKIQATDCDMRDAVLDCVDSDCVVHFVEVDVPLPEPATLIGEVVS